MKTAICAIIKNEHDYLEEWLNYHLNLGIDEIYLYEDNGSLSHSKIVSKYDSVHLLPINTIFNDGKYVFTRKYAEHCSLIQEKLFDYFPNVYKDVFDWILFIDIDEFLYIDCELNELLNNYKDNSILLHWKFYSASGHINKPVGGVLENYTDFCITSLDYNYNDKSFVNTKKFEKWITYIHKVNNAVYPLTEYGQHRAYIKHYFTKSWEEWKTKLLSRGDLMVGHRKITDFFILNPDLEYKKNELLLEIAIDNAKKIGFNSNIEYVNTDKLVHFCWFGGNEFSDVTKRCFKSWKKYIPDDYIVCLWNENCFDFNSIEFTKDAYNHKKWAYVSDYARLWCIYTFGGLYLDTDVELVKPISNLPVNFMAIEKDYDSIALGLGFAAEKNNNVIRNLLEIYNSIQFEKEKMYSITIPKITMDYFYSNGYILNNNDIHEYLGFTIYPDEYFCAKSNETQTLKITENTYAIHHYNGSWAID